MTGSGMLADALLWLSRGGAVILGVTAARALWRVGDVLTAEAYLRTAKVRRALRRKGDAEVAVDVEGVRAQVVEAVRAYREQHDREAEERDASVAAGIAQAVRTRTEAATGRALRIFEEAVRMGAPVDDAMDAAAQMALFHDRVEAGRDLAADPDVVTLPAGMEAPQGWQGGAAARTCRACGCTDADCSGCVGRTGRPCRWVEPDLCSACVDPVDHVPCEGDPPRLDPSAECPSCKWPGCPGASGPYKGIYDPGKICPNCGRPPGEGAP